MEIKAAEDSDDAATVTLAVASAVTSDDEAGDALDERGT